MRTHLLPLLFLAACASRDWRVATQADTSVAYARFVAENPTHAKAEVARSRAEERGWAEAQAADTSTAYGAYVSAFPNGAQASVARERGETMAWTEARTDGTMGGLTAYVARFPSSPNVTEAYRLLEQIWYEEAKSANTEASWGRYLVRYPKGLWSDEARREREALGWAAAQSSSARVGYEAYLDHYPQGAHAADATGWLTASRVLTVQPIVVLVGTWQADKLRATVLSRVKGALDTGLVVDLRRDFKVLPTKTSDLKGGEPTHPQDTWGATPDVGLLVIEYTEVPGRAFQPSGHATDIRASMRLYSPNSRTPVFDRALDASTPTKISGADASALHTSAVADLGGQLRTYAEELASNKRTAR